MRAEASVRRALGRGLGDVALLMGALPHHPAINRPESASVLDRLPVVADTDRKGEVASVAGSKIGPIGVD